MGKQRICAVKARNLASLAMAALLISSLDEPNSASSRRLSMKGRSRRERGRNHSAVVLIRPRRRRPLGGEAAALEAHIIPQVEYVPAKGAHEGRVLDIRLRDR